VRNEQNRSSWVPDRCVECPQGTFTTNETSAVNMCLDCLSGFKQPSVGQVECVPCEPGFFQTERGQETCDSCAPGGYCSSLESCGGGFMECAPGTYNEKPGQNNATACLPCGVGTFSTINGANSSKVCQKCAGGSFTNKSGSTTCKLCSNGEYQGEVGQTSCLKCGAGNFSNLMGLKECSLCPNRLSSDIGSKSCDYSVFIVAYECDVADPYAEATGKTYNQGDKITICVSDVSKDIVQVEEFVDLVITQDGINDYNFITGTLYNPDITTPVCLDATATQRRLCYASMRALARFFQSQSPTDLTISGSVNVIRDGRRVRRKLRMALPAAEMTNDETSLGVFGRRIEEEAEGRGKFEMNVSLTSGDDSAGFFGGEATGLVSMAIGSAGLALMA